jgi:hypothetical protein
MAENIGALILPIGADASQFNRSINDVKAAFKELSNTIAATPFNLVTDKQKLQLNALKETLTVLTTDVKAFGEAVKIPENSILGLTNRIAELNKKKISLDAKTSAVEIARLTKEIERLTNQKNNIDNLGRSVSQVGNTTQGGFKKIEDSTKGAGRALTSLSLVAQDLPFGFIGIQNNLPALIQTFGELQRTSGGVKGALGQLVSSISGPAGLFFAFSAATAGVTFLVQKYGSLGNAIDAIFSKNEKLTLSIQEAAKSYKEFQKSVRDSNDVINQESATTTGQIARVEALSNVIKNSNTSYENRKKAISDLQSISEDFFGTLNSEKLNFEELEKAVKNYTASIVQAAITKGFEDDIVSTNKELVAQQKLLKKLAEEVKVARAAPIQIQGIDGRREDLRLIKEAESRYNAQKVIVDNLKSSLKELNTEINKSVTEQVNLQKNVDNTTESLKKQGTIGKIPGLREIIEGTQEEGVITTNLALFERYIQGQVRINNAGVDKMVRYRREQLNALDLMPNKLEKEVGTLGLSLPFGPEAQKNLQEYYNGLLEIQDIDQDIIDTLTKGLGAENIYEKAIKDLLNFESYQKAAADRISRNFRFLQRPLEDLFGSVLEDGIANWQAFGDAVVVEIKKIAAALLAKSFITALGNLLAPGLGSVLGRGFSTISDQGLGDWLDIFDSKANNVNFGGVQGGGMQMAGAVNLTLRGSDLVGSINRTNSTINRVG